MSLSVTGRRPMLPSTKKLKYDNSVKDKKQSHKKKKKEARRHGSSPEGEWVESCQTADNVSTITAVEKVELLGKESCSVPSKRDDWMTVAFSVKSRPESRNEILQSQASFFVCFFYQIDKQYFK